MKSKIELRANDITLTSIENDDKLVVEGYVNETGKWSYQMRSKKGPFIEKIEKGAFGKALKNSNDIHFLAEHDKNRILASTRNGSLTLTEDDKGLLMRATISKTSYGKDYYELIKDGILRNMSFGFYPLKDNWKKNDKGILERSISDLHLFEVSVVTNPAYPQSNIQSRGMDLIEEVEVTEIKEEEERKLDSYQKIKELLNKKNEGENKNMKIEERTNEITTKTNAEVVGATNGNIDIMEELVSPSNILTYVRKKFVNRNNMNENKEVLVESAPGKAKVVEEGQSASLESGICKYKSAKAEYKRYAMAEKISQHFINEIDIQSFVEVPFAKSIYAKIGEDVVNAINTGATKKVSSERIDKTLINNMVKALPKKYLDGAIFVCDENTYNALDELYGNSNMDYICGVLMIKGMPVIPIESETETLQLANLNRCIQVNLEEKPEFKSTQGMAEAIRGEKVFVSDLYAAITLADLDAVVVKGE